MLHWLPVLLLLAPLAAALALLAVPASRTPVFRSVALAAGFVQVGLLAVLITQYQAAGANAFTLRTPWLRIDLGDLGQLHADFFLAIDGLSLSLIALAVVVLLVAVAASWQITYRAKGYFLLMLILNAAIIGTFCAMDLLLFFLFFEFMLLPMYFLIGIWGGPKKEYAAIKFFVYTFFGSVMILVVIIVLNLAGKTFGIPELTAQPFAGSVLAGTSDAAWGGLSVRAWCFLLLATGFAIKLPVFPFHTWLPDAHVEAATPVSVILAALLLKVGGYGLARVVYPIFPQEVIYFSAWLGAAGAITIVYGALNALASKDLKRLIAYSSVSHMGFVVLGLTTGAMEGITGAVFQMVSHGFISAMLFLIAGVLYDRAGDRQIANFSGLHAAMPHFTALVMIAFFASLGLPGFSGFVAELLVLAGAFQSHHTNQLIALWMPFAALAGIVITAGFCVWTIQRMFFGDLFCRAAVPLPDLSQREKWMLYPLAAIIFILGVWPQFLLDWIQPFSRALHHLLTSTP
jgi:NADH-quinone oxidoreductase subunit M